jgi:hypothetical protein
MAIQQGGGWAARARGLVARLGLAVWAAAMLLIGAILMASHWLGLPVPVLENPRLQAALAELGGAGGRWQLVHVLYSECRCSQRTLDYLQRRATPAHTLERLLLVGSDAQAASAARQRGFLVEEITPAELSQRFQLEAAPLLLVVDPEGSVRYAGGYTERQQGLDYRDLTILARLRERGGSERLPAYGCAVSRELQDQLDPLGVKYLR